MLLQTSSLYWLIMNGNNFYKSCECFLLMQQIGTPWKCAFWPDSSPHPLAVPAWVLLHHTILGVRALPQVVVLHQAAHRLIRQLCDQYRCSFVNNFNPQQFSNTLGRYDIHITKGHWTCLHSNVLYMWVTTTHGGCLAKHKCSYWVYSA